jgi:hypothetical protein
MPRHLVYYDSKRNPKAVKIVQSEAEVSAYSIVVFEQVMIDEYERVRGLLGLNKPGTKKRKARK